MQADGENAAKSELRFHETIGLTWHTFSCTPGEMDMSRADRLTFGPYEFELRARRLTKYGHRLRLQPKSALVLAALLERPGTVALREDLHRRLWPEGTHVDFDDGLNVAVKKLREALNDSTDEPRYVQTVHGEGYRFIADVRAVAVEEPQPVAISIPETPVPASTHRSRRHITWKNAAVAAMLLLVVCILLITTVAFRERQVGFYRGDWAMIADFDNRSGDSNLNGALESALARELDNSKFVHVVPRERVEDALRLMRKPLDSKVDRRLGRELCMRDGDIRVLLAGRVEKIGRTYDLDVDIVDPARDVTLATESDEADTADQLLSAVHRLSDRVRRQLGEVIPQVRDGDPQLAKVATPSAAALRLYTQADRLMHGTRSLLFDSALQASDLLQQAVRADPDFASAHLLLGYTLREMNERERAKAEFTQALQLADTGTERERLFIVASYYDNVGGGDAVQAYQALLRVYPDHYWAVQNLAVHYWRAGDLHDYVNLQYKLADLRPNDLEVTNNAATVALFYDNDRNRFHQYLARAQRLAEQESKNGNADDLLITNLLPVEEAWTDRDAAAALAALRRAQAIPTGSVYEPTTYGKAYASLGQFRSAQNEFEKFADKKVAILIEARLAYIRGDVKQSRALLGQAPAFANPVDWWLRAATGVWRNPSDIGPEYRVWMARNRRQATVVLAELALHHSSSRVGGIARMEQALANAPDEPLCAAASVSLARAYELTGKFDAAERILKRETASFSRVLSRGDVLYAPYWLDAKFELAQVERKLGRPEEAAKIEGDLSKWLAVADADDPIVVGLKHSDRNDTRTASAGQ